MPQAETIGTKFEYLMPEGFSDPSVLEWPPDVFCLCAAVIQVSGAYTRVVEDEMPHLEGTTSRRRAAFIRKVGFQWMRAAAGQRAVPKEVIKWWETVQQHKNLTLHELCLEPAEPCFGALLYLLGTADEACAGIGIYKLDPELKRRGGLDPFQFKAEGILVQSMATAENGATLCRDIHPSKARVLPKMHTPQNGLTIRSFSHHIAYCLGSDMRPNWISLSPPKKSHSLNLLVIPWPYVVEPMQFVPTKKVGITDDIARGSYGLFTFASGTTLNAADVVELVKQAEKLAGHVDGVVFPELAMGLSEFDEISDSVVTKERFLVAGVGKSAGKRAGSNEAYIDVADPNLHDQGRPVKYRFVQRKHHRWKLTKSQIVQYGIGMNLLPGADWFEHIPLGNREISFVSLREWLTMSVLICEDLARPDPVGDVMRAVGPNLIIALLSDGPQLIGRWPSRYAGVLADDPGSSVLTVTNSGMAGLSRSSDPSKQRSDVVAFWRDARNGTTEIVCPKDCQAVVLNVTAEYHEEWTADGRGDGKCSGYPVLSGYHPVRRPATRGDNASV